MSRVVFCAAAIICGPVSHARAQDPPPIGPLTFDLRGMLPRFPGNPALAASRGLDQSALPGRGIGIDAGAHVYLFKLGAATVGLGGQITLARARSAAAPPQPAVGAGFTAIAPQLSLNFGTGDGWSYISGGVGVSRWSIVPDNREPLASDEAWVRTFDYGGGARWFLRPRVAFHLDVRLHAIDPGPIQLNLPGSPRTNLLIIGAGVSVR